MGYFPDDALRWVRGGSGGAAQPRGLTLSAPLFGDDEAQFVGCAAFVGHDVNAVCAGAPFAFRGVGERDHAAFAGRIIAFFRPGFDATAGSRNGADADRLVGNIFETEFSGNFAAALGPFDGDFLFLPLQAAAERDGGCQQGEAKKELHREIFSKGTGALQAVIILGWPSEPVETLIGP